MKTSVFTLFDISQYTCFAATRRRGFFLIDGFSVLRFKDRSPLPLLYYFKSH